MSIYGFDVDSLPVMNVLCIFIHIYLLALENKQLCLLMPLY